MRPFERLIKYTKFETASDARNECCPTTEGQRVFGESLVLEMKELGIKDAFIDEYGYVYGTIPANIDGVSPIGFIAHMDTVSEVPYSDIKTKIISNYDGGDILLNESMNIVMTTKEFPDLLKYKGKSLVVTDGTTLLGADDKAGIANILTMAELLNADPTIKHGEIKIGFTPDEEIGRGANLFDVDGFGAPFAYTADGGEFGQVTYENFNAAAAEICISGINYHPGSAKGNMVNALSVAAEFDFKLPQNERPQYTEGYEGFYHLVDMSGTVERVWMQYILRDFDEDKLNIKKETIKNLANMLNKIYGENTIEYKITNSYQNMKKAIDQTFEIVELAKKAIENAGGAPISEPIRGGTDGARLSFMGLPCPNIGTGGHNAHSKKEYAVIEEMEDCVEMMMNIVTIHANNTK